MKEEKKQKKPVAKSMMEALMAAAEQHCSLITVNLRIRDQETEEDKQGLRRH